MSQGLTISNVRVTLAGDHEIRGGLVAWVSFLVNERIRIDGAAIRVTTDGRRILTYPQRTDRRGVAHPLVFPVSDEARLEIERQVFAQIRAEVAS